MSRSCLCGLFDIAGIRDPNEMSVDIRIGCPCPEKLDLDDVKKMVPFGTVTAEAVAGGLDVKGLYLAALGEGDTIVVAVASLTVYVDTP